jgi:hypothetical protein
MKQIRCINAKNFNLTVGKEYSTLNENDNDSIVSIVNDRGLTRNYNASLFEDVVNLLNYDDILESIDFSSTYNNRTHVFRISVLDVNSAVRIINFQLQTNSTDISCGVMQLFRVNRMLESIDEIFRSIDLTGLSETQVNNLITHIIKLTIKDIIQSHDSIGAILISTNESGSSISENVYELFNNFLCSITDVYASHYNPNTENTIKTWYIVLTPDSVTSILDDWEE